MKAKDMMILAGAAVAVYMLLRTMGSGTGGGSGASDYWPIMQGNTGYPDAAYTGIPAAGGGVWV